MNKITSIALLLLAFFAGYSLDSIINPNLTDRVITPGSPRNSETSSYESKQNISLENKLDVILTELNSISLNMNRKQPSYTATNDCNSEISNIPSYKNTYVTGEDIADAKNQIYNSLLETNYTFNQLVISDELNDLSPIDKQEVLDEVARRIDSGEINKEDFLPGYKSSSN